MRYVVALGGNALLRRSERPDAAVQQHHVRAAAAALAPVITGNEVLICHGNGPQIGMLALESAADSALSEPYPFDALGAQTQGMIGYWLAQELANAGVVTAIAVVLTQTVVDPADPAFAHPTKFVGPGYDHAHAQRLQTERLWSIAPDGPAWRRVVASPQPRALVELPIIRDLVAAGATVICAGGGGVPVVHEGGALHGIDAVVDKDLAAALLAEQVNADRFVVLTDVDAVKADFGTARERSLNDVVVEDLDTMSFPDGSMRPKLLACARFATATGRPAVIGALDDAAAVLAGHAGTIIWSRAVRPVSA